MFFLTYTDLKTLHLQINSMAWDGYLCTNHHDTDFIRRHHNMQDIEHRELKKITPFQQGCVGDFEVLCPLSLGGHSDSLFPLTVGSCCKVGVSEG